MTDIVANPSLSVAQGSAKATETEAWDADASFYLTMVLLSAALIFVGFAPSFYLKSEIHSPPPLTRLTIVHGLVFTAWILLFIAQVLLIAQKQPALHRQLGILGAVLYGAVASLGLSTAITAGRLGHAPPAAPAPLAFMALSLFLIVAALALVSMALWNRRRSDWHKRLMLVSLFMMTGPGTGRIAIHLGLAAQEVTLGFFITELLLAVAILHDYRVHQHVHRAYWIAVGVFVVVHLGVMWAFASPRLDGVCTRDNPNLRAIPLGSRARRYLRSREAGMKSTFFCDSEWMTA